MKDQYFGDFGDYQKTSLLRILQGQGFSILLHWMRTEDDGSTDGKHTAYLSKPELWRSFDKDIYDFLKKKSASGKRTLLHMERSKFCPKVQFLNKHIEDIAIRGNLLQKAIESGADIVLFDPDNGVEVASTNKKNAHKYVTWKEVEAAYNSGKSVIAYQHYSRTNRRKFIANKLKETKQHTSCEPFAIQARHSAYLFLPQRRHTAKLKKAAKEFSRIWGDIGVVH